MTIAKAVEIALYIPITVAVLNIISCSWMGVSYWLL